MVCIKIQAQSNMPKMSTLTLVTGTSSPTIWSPCACVHISLTVGSGNETPSKRHTCSFQKAGLRNSCPFLCAMAGRRCTGDSLATEARLTLAAMTNVMTNGKWSPCCLIPFGRASFLGRLWHSEIYSSMLCNFGLTRNQFKARVSG